METSPPSAPMLTSGSVPASEASRAEPSMDELSFACIGRRIIDRRGCVLLNLDAANHRQTEQQQP